tara:strand:+ start:7732 stop:8619 length:888 start_codon:yes stop_codon:yes gene_type:complete
MILEELRPKSTCPSYPPYHTGKYLEEYFFDYYERNKDRFDSLDRKYIPVYWTNCYNNGALPEWGDKMNMLQMQAQLNTLEPNDSYFTVCQHDDAPMNSIPQNTVVFSAGGRVKTLLTIPTPLICGRIPNQTIRTKKYLASFVGSNTHPIRQKMIDAMDGKSGIKINSEGWNMNVSDDRFIDFIETSLESRFVLCPRGYGPASFRLYEAMQLDAVPVYVTDDLWLPWNHDVKWEEFCVIVSDSPGEINSLYERLQAITDEEYESMKTKVKEVYNKYFTLEGTCDNILRILESEKRL